VKTWITLLYLGRVFDVLGPSYDTMQVCRDAIQDRAQFAMFADRAGYSIDDITLDCVRARDRPRVGEQR